MLSGTRLAALATVVAALAVPVLAAPPGYQSSRVPGLPAGVAGLTYGPDGTLYLAGNNSSAITVVSPGGQRSELALTGANLVSIGGMNVGPDGRLFITDNKGWGDGLGDLYAVNTLTGAAQTIISGIEAIEDVAIRASGEIFITDAAGTDFVTGAKIGRVVQAAYDSVSGSYTAVPLVTELVYTAGLGLDAQGNLIFQQANASFAGEVYRLPITAGPGGLVFGQPALVAGGLAAGFDLAIDGEDDIFVTGNGGLYKLDRDAGGNFTGAASVFDAHGFSTELAFYPGSNAFEPFAGLAGGRLAFVPEYLSTELVEITTVPEPACVLMLLAGAAALGRKRRA